MFGGEDERIRMWCIDKCRDPFGGVDMKRAQELYDFVTTNKPTTNKK